MDLTELTISAGFLNTPGPVKIIWMTQAGAVITGHVIALLLAHALAMRANIVADGLDQERRVAVLGGVDIEIAIRADARAIRPVNIKAEPEMRTERMKRFVRHGSSAAFSLRKASARWLMACLRSGSISPNVIVSPSATKMGS